LRTAIRSFAVVACVVCLYFIADSLGGKRTEVVALLETFVRVGADRWAYLIVIALLGGAYYRERRVRRSQSKELGTYAKQLEARIDPGRTSSRLTLTGDPSKEDRDD